MSVVIESPSQNASPVWQHLSELRRTLIGVCLSLVISFAICLYFSEAIYQWLAKPLLQELPQGTNFITTHPFEAWLTLFKTAFFAAIFLSAPLMIWCIWRFVSPGLFKSEKKLTLLVVILASMLFIGGGFFGYQLVFPVMFKYFVEVTSKAGVQFLPQMSDYLTFAFKMLLSFSVIFETPFLVFILSITELVSFKKLVSFQRYMIVISFLISAILTPPDVVSQIMMGIPICCLYEAGLLFAWIFKRKSKTEISPA